MDEDIEKRVSGLLAAEAIIAGFLFASTAIQWQAMQEYLANPPIPASTFLATFINFYLIIIAVRCIWLSLKAYDKADGRQWYLASYRIFVAVLLCAILFNVLPSMLSIFRIYVVQSWTPPTCAQCVQFIPCNPKHPNILVLPRENYAAPVVGLVATALTLLTFFFPKPVSAYILRLRNRKHLLLIAILCFLVGFIFIPLGYPTMCCEGGLFAPPQASLYVELFFAGFADFHRTYGRALMLIGKLALIFAMVTLGYAVDWRSVWRWAKARVWKHRASDERQQLR